MSRKHMLQKSLQEEVEPPSEGQDIVMAVGSRGSNIMEVEFPDGRRTLCLLPARFHKKLWIKRGNYLIVENVEGVDAAVTGQIVHVLFADHVKQLKKIPGVWPREFNAASDADAAAADLDRLSLGAAAAADKDDGSNSDEEAGAPAAQENEESERKAAAAAEGGEGEEEEEYSSSDDDLPPIARPQNRKVIVYEISDTDSDSD